MMPPSAPRRRPRPPRRGQRAGTPSPGSATSVSSRAGLRKPNTPRHHPATMTSPPTFPSQGELHDLPVLPSPPLALSRASAAAAARRRGTVTIASRVGRGIAPGQNAPGHAPGLTGHEAGASRDPARPYGPAQWPGLLCLWPGHSGRPAPGLAGLPGFYLPFLFF